MPQLSEPEQKQMRNDMQLQKLGAWLCVAIALLVSSTSCRRDPPPILSIICIGDGVGGANCVDSGGNKIYKKPSELKDFWMTTQPDQANYTAWCYDTSKENAEFQMLNIERTIKGE